MNNKQRPSPHAFWMQLAALYAQRATCLRRKCAALFVQGGRLVVAGYNGAPSGQPHCIDDGVGCLMVENHCARCLHAEYAAICFAAVKGIAIGSSTVYIHGGTPCRNCALGLIAVGVKEIYVDAKYPDDVALRLLDMAGVKVVEMW